MKSFVESKIRNQIDIYRKRKILNALIKEYKNTAGKVVFLLQTPIHTNIGDQAIAQAEVDFIAKFFTNYSLVEVNQSLLDMFCERFEGNVRSTDLIMLHGGGNMGDQYLNEEIHRRKVVKTFPNNKIIVFPQTIYFSSTDQGNKQLEITKSIFSRHDDLTIIAREKVSFELMKKEFAENTVLLTPDIVLSMDKSIPVFEREGILLVLRNDVEKMLTEEKKSEIFNSSKKYREKVTITDMYNGRNVHSGKYRKEVLNGKFAEFKQAEVVVTDRLHGMILAAITETPCIAFTNYNQKVSGTYEWVKKLNYIKFLDLNSEFDSELLNLLNLENKTSLKSIEILKEFKDVICLNGVKSEIG